jgi:hypothetical protein
MASKNIRNFIKKQIKLETGLIEPSSKPVKGKSIDLHQLMNYKFKPIPSNINQREHNIKVAKAHYDFSFLERINNRALVRNERTSQHIEEDIILFSKINPARHISSKIRPNNFDWSINQYNERAGDRLIAKDDEEKQSNLY